MSHMIPVSCVPGVLAPGLVVYPDEGGGMSSVVCETLLGRARVDGLGWQESEDLWCDLDNANTRDMVLRAIQAESVSSRRDVPHWDAYRADDGRLFVMIGNAVWSAPIKLYWEGRQIPGLATVDPNDPIAALAAVCRGPR